MGGIAKGSGMIHPNMATLLSVITTDANVEPSLWHTILLHGVQKSFNQVSASRTSLLRQSTYRPKLDLTTGWDAAVTHDIQLVYLEMPMASGSLP